LTASLAGPALPRPIQQNPPHHGGRHRKEVGPMLPVHIRNVDQPQVRLVYQSRCLQRSAWAFVLHEMPSDSAKLLVDTGRELL
jgi:hypothetical protein